MNPTAYVPRRPARSRFVTVRTLRCHVLEWGTASPDAVPLVMAHGWMDLAASFQFVVDAFERERHVIAFDWRGFGQSDPGGSDGYWFPDYLGDLDTLLEAPELGLAGRRVDLLGHSMGGNVAMMYAGVRPLRVRRLVNLEGFGMPKAAPELAPQRYAQWLDELREPARLKPYDSLAAVAQRLRATNPLLSEDKAAWLATQWAAPAGEGRWALRADPTHKRVNPVLYRVEEALACWQRIAAPLLWVEGDRTDMSRWWGHRYPREEFEARLGVVANVERCRLSPAGHMLHHDQPEALAARLEAFLG